MLINCRVLFHKDAVTHACNWVLSVSVSVGFMSHKPQEGNFMLKFCYIPVHN